MSTHRRIEGIEHVRRPVVLQPLTAKLLGCVLFFGGFAVAAWIISLALHLGARL